MSKPKLKPVKELEFEAMDSSNISGSSYDASEKVLYVKFKHGGIYAYKDVPVDTAAAFKGAESAGKYLHASIKDKFEFEKVA